MPPKSEALSGWLVLSCEETKRSATGSDNNWSAKSSGKASRERSSSSAKAVTIVPVCLLDRCGKLVIEKSHPRPQTKAIEQKELTNFFLAQDRYILVHPLKNDI
eukprot:Platyproteum_vivax@DN7643_c0_g1_i5.p2